jgi:hypothetical protein
VDARSLASDAFDSPAKKRSVTILAGDDLCCDGGGQVEQIS